MKVSPKVVLVAIGACLLSLVAACGGGSSGGGSGSASSSGGGTAAVKIGLVQAQDFVHAMPARVAEQQGFFKAHGLDVSVVGFTSGSDLTKAMVGGSVDVGAATGLDAVSGAAKHLDLPAFYGVMSASPMALIVGKNSTISGFSDLAGKKVGISAAGSLTDFITRAAAKKAGVAPDKLKEVPLGAPSSTISALSRGDVDAFVLPVNFGFQEEASGQGRIAQKVSDVLGQDSQFAVLMAKKSYIDGNKATLDKLAAAYKDALTWMQGHRTETVALAVSKLSMDQKIAEQTYDALASKFTPDGSINKAGMKAYADALPELNAGTSAPDESAYLSTAIKPGQ